jgi:DNA primase
MSVSKTNGKFICFNASCGTTGSIQDLVKAMLKTNEFQTARIIANAKEDSTESFLDVLQKALTPVEFTEWAFARTIPSMEQKLFDSPRAYKYMVETRGFDESILREYHIGYNYKRDLICVPMYSAKGIPLGVIGRSPSITDKQFKNSPGLPTSKSLWNIHKAKRTGDTVIVCEASFDAMRIAQAGYPNVVACLGGNFSDYHEEQLGMYFSNIVIMTDFDDSEKHRYASCRKCMQKGLDRCIGHNPGRALGQKIADKMKGKSIKWAATDYGLVYPEGCKDAGDMSMDQIIHAIKNAVSNMEYQSWGIAS